MVRYDFWAQRDGVDYRRLRVPKSSTPTISFTANAEIKATISLDMEPDAAVDWLTDHLAVTRVRDDGSVDRLGTFYVTTAPAVTDESGHTVLQLTGYDPGYAVKKLALLETAENIGAGTNYAAAITAQLLAAGIRSVRIDPTPLVLASDRTWEIGTPRYQVVADLLREINYRGLWFDGEGVAVCERWAQATIDAAKHRYGQGEAVKLEVPMTATQDTFDAANVFVELVTSPDQPPMTASAENSNPTSPLSIQRRGRRIVSVEVLDSAPSQAALQSIAATRMLLSMMSAELYSFDSDGDAETPHGLNDSLLLSRDGAGLLEEQDWRLECMPGGKMRHTARRIYYAVD